MRRQHRKLFQAKFITISSIAILMICSLNACKNRQNTAHAMPSSEPLQEEFKLPNSYSLVLSFYSIGSGSDWEVIGEMDAFLDAYRKSGKSQPEVERIPWGREGEVDFCIQTGKMNPADSESFRKSVLEIARKAKFVHINENAVCRYKR